MYEMARRRLRRDMSVQLGRRRIRQIIPPGADWPAMFDLLADDSVLGDLRQSIYGSRSLKRLVPSGATWTGTGVQMAPALLAVLCARVARLSPERAFHGLCYNIDTLLEEALNAQGYGVEALVGGQIVRFPPTAARLRRSTMAYPVETVRIAHPHGLLPREPEPSFDDNDVRRTLILGAEAYDGSISAPFAQHNVWQLSAFSGLKCLFYGWSFTDYAVRRLLRLGRTLSVHTAAATPSHLALLRARVPRGKCQVTDRVDSLAARELRALGVMRLRTDTFEQQRTFLQVFLKAP